ncbi:dynein regulatory complex subunit 7 [Hemicordylus capensis]|uniref:dynein regulatory complex subunit 7 n=1 Tax=Hemicordylus capensis TaxID=884348 RepID=UPI002302AAFB|nr:dynein regulatory complex subunit 7 [Hemicordylus capensis]XP_053127438.1 dynein regulatory complex subunit 7 [Hemicordylus capensis]XP_053127439.1 dynein regulatory complex subunit 7 [Hemicordylus capensis]
MESSEEEEYESQGEEEDWEEEEEEGLSMHHRSAELQDLEEQLSRIEVHIPEVVYDFDWSSVDTSNLPESYRTNSAKEQLLLQVADNFHRQYAHLCPDREPLFLHPVNECGIEKFVSTTVRPTLLPYSELYNWDGAARFVSDYLNMEPLPSPIAPPSYMYSPTTILRYQRGNCFDFSVLLCSLLIGAGYDAYCVNGYATREMCLMDETREVCPLLKKSEEVVVEAVKEKPKKYAIKPLRDLRSKFEMRLEAKAQAIVQAADQKKQKEEDERIAEAEKPKPDSLYGLRVHGWVLVLSGKREVPESFFIDPFTGKSYCTTDDHFLGIESVWNHRNYWVNMQDCWNACKDLLFDLGDPVRWEFMLLGADKPILSLPEVEEEEEMGDDEIEDLLKEEEPKGFDMPASWVDQIHISPKEFETRCPQGKKVIQYKYARLEQWAPYLNSSGLVSRLTIFEDLDCTRVLKVKEWFKNREDLLETRELNKKTQVTTEHFGPGHLQGLKAHIYKTLVPETERTMDFYSETRVDGLQKRVETPQDMTEYFEGRSDFLIYRHTDFGKRAKKVGPTPFSGGDTNARPILKITERFRRNPNKPADEDVAERIFSVVEDKILLTYHCKENYITPSKREFNKRTEVDSKGNKIIMTQEMCLSYQAGSTEKEKKLFHLYEMMMQLIEDEKLSKHLVWESEMEVLDILRIREEEEAASKLTVSIYDTERNEKSKEQREAMERLQQEERQRQVEQDLDYLAPFLVQMGGVEKMTKWVALRLKEDCLSDFKQRLVDKANLIQARFEKETQELQKKQQWYQQNQLNMTLEDEDAYLNYCSDAMFRIRILELRLSRHKERAPQKYMALEEKLCKDPRLCDYLKFHF